METNSGNVAAAQNTQQQKAEDLSSRFTGGAFANFGINFLMYFVTVITLGIAYPVMKCRKMRWEVRHTYINGRQLTFDGRAKSLYGKYMIWLLLSVVTLGIYYLFCMSINLVRWQTEHTHISGTAGGESKFTGSALGRFGVAFVSGLVTVVTLSFGMYWARCYKERWFAKHKIIDGLRVEFDGKGNWTELKCKYSQVPVRLIPSGISKYVKSNYPSAKVIEIERDRNEYDVKLSTGLEITFNKKFQVIDIDN